MEFKNNVLIDKRTKEEILKEIRLLADSYTPEWKFDLENPDAGSVIAMIFANQLSENISRSNFLLEKYQTELSNLCEVSLKPVTPAASVAVVSLGATAEQGVPFYKNSQIIAEGENGNDILFETAHDIYVTKASLTEVLGVSEEHHCISPYQGAFYHQDLITGEKKEDEFGVDGNIHLFAGEIGIKEEPAIILYHQFGFYASGEKIYLQFYGAGGEVKLAERLCDQRKFQFYTLTEDGMIPAEVSQENGMIEVTYPMSHKKIKKGNREYSVLILKQGEEPDGSISLEKIQILSRERWERPEFSYDGNKELELSQCTPFGERPVLYGEWYIGKDEWMRQGGSEIVMRFHLAFDTAEETGKVIKNPNLSIIKLKPKIPYNQVEYESWIQEISVEYFNGTGWRALECTPAVNALFSGEKNNGDWEVSFRVPKDWKETVQGGYEGRCIRIQIKRADNCYIPDAHYYYPIISGLSLCKKAPKIPQYPDLAEYVERTRRTEITSVVAGEKNAVLFQEKLYGGEYLYLGFDRAFESGPVSIFWKLEQPIRQSGIEIEYSYSTTSGFYPLKVSDRTNQFRSTGIVLFMPPEDQGRMELEGLERYWIRVEAKQVRNEEEPFIAPIVKSILLNAVDIENRETGQEQEYFIDTVERNASFPLYGNNILYADVWVNEKGQISRQEMEELQQKHPEEVRAEYNLYGDIEDFFVKWAEVDSFQNTGGKTRVYRLDRGSNQIFFGDGVKVKIPQNIVSTAFKVRLTRSSGAEGNLKEQTPMQLRNGVRQIEAIYNPLRAAGGSNMETLERALYRGSTLLSSRKRLVSGNDYVRAALTFSDEIDQAVCLTGIDETNKKCPEQIKLVLLMKDFQGGTQTFRSLRNGLRTYMLSKCELTCGAENLEIIEPVFVKISVRVWLGVKNISKSLKIREYFLEAITEYLDPHSTTSYGGWKIGTLPKESQIRMMLVRLETEAFVSHYSISAIYQDSEGVHEKELDAVKVTPFMVCCNGTHQITMNEKLE